jgi:hypothetical protein
VSVAFDAKAAGLVNEIGKRLLARTGIHLGGYIQDPAQITSLWQCNPRGFTFYFDPPEDYQEFKERLIKEDQTDVAPDPWFGQIFQGGHYSIREVTIPGKESMHIKLKFGYPETSSSAMRHFCTIHIDSTGICKRKGSVTGTCDYDYSKVWGHARKDKYHK